DLAAGYAVQSRHKPRAVRAAVSPNRAADRPSHGLLVSVAAAVAPAAITAAAIASTEAALSRSGRHRQGGRHHLGVDLLVDRQALRRQLFDRRLPAQVQPAL